MTTHQLQFSPSVENEQADHAGRDEQTCLVRPNYLQIIRRERGQGNVHFPCSSAFHHKQNWQPHPVDSYSHRPDIHIYSQAQPLVFNTGFNHMIGSEGDFPPLFSPLSPQNALFVAVASAGWRHVLVLIINRCRYCREHVLFAVD